jgi:hypothetical protein
LNQTAAFISFAAGWSLLCGLLLSSPIHPIAIFAVWLVGFVWGVGYISAGKTLADLLTKRWLQMMLALAIFGGAVALFLS